MPVNVNRKGRHKERSHKKEEPEKSAARQQPDMEQESSNVVEEAEPAEEENIYISDQEEDERGFCVHLAFSASVKGTLRRRLTYIFFSFNKKFNISHFHLQSLDSQFLP